MTFSSTKLSTATGLIRRIVCNFTEKHQLTDLLVTLSLTNISRTEALHTITTQPNNTCLPPGSFRCGQDCATCPYITNGLTHYTFFSTGATRQIKSHITCNTKNLIYMIQCNRCSLQYIGETKRRLKDRFNEHRRSVDKTKIKSKPTTVAEHFLSHPNHCHTDMQLIPFELIPHSSRDSIRKARESLTPF